MTAPKVTRALGACLALASAAFAQVPPRVDELRVMSFNIRYGTANDGPDAWENRRGMLIALLARESPDLIGIQEGLYLQLGEIRAALPEYGGIGAGRDDGVLGGEFAAILYRRDRFNIVNSGTFWFSDTPEVPGSRSWGNTITRICTWAHLREAATGRRFWIYNVHLDHESQPSRERSVALLLERIRARGGDDPVIVTGDFNAGEDNPAALAMRQAGFRDTYRVRHPSDTVVGTFNAFRGDSTGPKIDFVFVDSAATVLDARILRGRPRGRDVSDHFAVTAALRLPARVLVDTLRGITVTATRSERRVEDQPMRVEVVEPEEVEEKTAMTPGDVAMLLNETGGLRVTSTAPSMGAANVRIHGLSGRYTQLLADGLPLYGPTSSLGLLQIPPMDLMQVEIVKGPASAMYGGGGLGGLVNFASRRPGRDRELLLNASTLGGADAVFFGSGRTSGTTGWTLLAGAHRQGRVDRDGDGWTDVAGYSRGVVRPRLFVGDRHGRTLLATAGLTVEDREGGTLPGDTAPDGLPFPEQLRTRRLDAGLYARWPTRSGLVLGTRAAGMFQSHAQTFGTERDQDRHVTGLLEATVAHTGARRSWLVGVALQEDAYRSDSVSRFDYTYTVPGVFGQLELPLSDRLVANVSMRADRHSAYGWQVHERVSALVRFGDGWTARLSGGTAYFASSPLTEETEEVGLRRLVMPERLRAERAVSLSADVGGFVGPIEVNATLFGAQVDWPTKAFVWYGGGGSPDSLRLFSNTEPTTSTGADLVARWVRAPWRVTASYTFQYTREGLNVGFDTLRQEVALNPRHALGLVGMWERGPMRVGAEAYYTGPQTLDDNVFRAQSPGYVVFGLLVQRDVGRARLFLNLENLGDARVTRHHPLVNWFYFGTTGWTNTAWGPLEGRVVNGGVRVRL